MLTLHGPKKNNEQEGAFLRTPNGQVLNVSILGTSAGVRQRLEERFPCPWLETSSPPQQVFTSFYNLQVSELEECGPKTLSPHHTDEIIMARVYAGEAGPKPVTPGGPSELACPQRSMKGRICHSGLGCEGTGEPAERAQGGKCLLSLGVSWISTPSSGSAVSLRSPRVGKATWSALTHKYPVTK